MSEMASLGQAFERISIHGNARVHLGNQYGLSMDPTSGHSTGRSGQQYPLRELLRPTSTAKDRFDAIRRTKQVEAVTGSGDWLVAEPALRDWICAAARPLLGVYGKAGCGKTFLAHRLISYLKTEEPRISTEANVAFFFCQAGSSSSESLDQMLRDLAFQISEQDKAYAAHISSQGLVFDNISTAWTAWRELFGADIWSSQPFRVTYFVLDGIDEMDQEERRMLLQLLNDITQYKRPAPIRVALVGRPEVMQDFDQFLRPFPSIYADSDQNRMDIHRYITYALQKHRRLSDTPSQLRQKIEQVLNSNTQGMFLYVKLMLDELALKTRSSEIEQALAAPPKGLLQVITGVLSHYRATASRESVEDLRDILAWVAFARRPLHLAELNAVLALKSAGAHDWVLDLEDRLRFTLGTLFELSREDGLTTSDLYTLQSPDKDGDNDRTVRTGSSLPTNPTTTTVKFSHATLYDYVRNPDVDVGSIAASFVGGHAHLRVAAGCVTLLINRKEGARDRENSDMTTYAAQNWIYHAAKVAPNPENSPLWSELGVGIYRLLTDRNALHNWVHYSDQGLWSVSSSQQLLSLMHRARRPHSLPPEANNWLKARSQRPLTIFDSAARVLTDRWLTSGMDQDVWRQHAMVLYAYHQRLSDRPSKRNEALTHDDIEALAREAEPNQTAYWHLGIVRVLYDLGLTSPAWEHFESSFGSKTQWSPALYLRGLMLQRAGQVSSAVTVYEAAVRNYRTDRVKPEPMRHSHMLATIGIAE